MPLHLVTTWNLYKDHHPGMYTTTIFLSLYTQYSLHLLLTLTTLTMAPIAVGDTIPDGILSYLDNDNKVQTISVHSLATGKKVIIFAVPGAFTPTCRYIY